MIDTFYEPIQDNGINYFVRYTNLQREEGRTHDVPDEIEIQANQARIKEEEESKRDITFEEFKSFFVDHIEGKIQPDRNNNHASDDEEAGAKEKSRTRSKGHSQKASMLKDMPEDAYDAKSNYSKDHMSKTG